MPYKLYCVIHWDDVYNTSEQGDIQMGSSSTHQSVFVKNPYRLVISVA